MKLFNSAILITVQLSYDFLKLKFFHSNLNFLDSYYSLCLGCLLCIYISVYLCLSLCLPTYHLSIYLPICPSIQNIDHYFKITEDNKRLTPINSLLLLFFFLSTLRCFLTVNILFTYLRKWDLDPTFQKQFFYQWLPISPLSPPWQPGVLNYLIPLLRLRFSPSTSSFLFVIKLVLDFRS